MMLGAGEAVTQVADGTGEANAPPRAAPRPRGDCAEGREDARDARSRGLRIANQMAER